MTISIYPHSPHPPPRTHKKCPTKFTRLKYTSTHSTHPNLSIKNINSPTSTQNISSSIPSHFHLPIKCLPTPTHPKYTFTYPYLPMKNVHRPKILPLTNHPEHTSTHPCPPIKIVYPLSHNQNTFRHTSTNHKKSPPITTQPRYSFTLPHQTNNIKLPIII